ncbi:MAG: hypothetical protein IPL61_24175 [Myxococcales bacterium]|nr:hypothetical protein [Myxococcales bacterium]
MSLIAILTTSMLACSDDNGSIPMDQFPSKLAAAACEQSFRCCDAAELMDRFQIFNPPPTTQAECTTALAALYQGLLFDSEALAAGRITYDEGAAADCVAAIDGAACSVELGQAGACERVLVGQVAAGGACKSSNECVGEASCDGATSTALGTCTALATVGMACDAASCVASAWCDFTTTTCAADKANGAACSFDDECTSDFCDPNNACADQPASMVCDGV